MSTNTSTSFPGQNSSGRKPPSPGRGLISGSLGLAVILMVTLLSPCAQAVIVNVVDDSNAAVSGFRWLVEEDTTYNVVPGVPDPATLAVRFHSSYMPVVAKGHSAGNSADISVPADKRYFISVLPDAGYTNSGAPVAIGQASATVVCSALPLPTAQITIFVFEDNSPINNAPDLPEEHGLEGFKVALYEAGGTFGASGGQMMMDIFGNPLGTTYDADGNMLTMGNGILLTDANGEVTIKNLAQGKYTIEIVPPTGEDWHQTSTIEGTPGVDAWVKPNEPPYFQEFGPPGWHVFTGFVRTINDTSVLSGGGTVSGQVVNLHTSRPPDYRFFAGEPVPQVWVGLNEMSVGIGRGVYTAPCDADGRFSIPNVPPGNYQLVFWDEPLDVIFATHALVMPAGDLDLDKIPVFNWFGRVRNMAFYDTNENGFPDPGEQPMSGVAFNLRFRDGSLYQSTASGPDGVGELTEVFPFFNWLVAESDYTRFKPTGATIVVDNGGEVLPHQGWTYPSFGVLTPQPQYDADGVTPLVNPNTGNNLSKTELGPVLTEGLQVFLGQTNVLAWGRSTYEQVDADNPPIGNFPSTEDVDTNQNGVFDPSNGGISGMAIYATTRAENDPRFAAAENWEPGIPRVQVNLYADNNNDQVIDDMDGDGSITLADVDNWPFDWKNAPNERGAEDLDRDGDGSFDAGDAVNIVTTDSWDDNIPTGAQGPPFVHLGVPTDAYDGLRNFNQVRPAVYDGGYIFLGTWQRNPDGSLVLDGDGNPVEAPGLPEGFYIVEANAPPGYEHQQEEDRNVFFGDTYKPALKSGLLELYPPCVGDPWLVPTYLTLFEDQQVLCEFRGQTRPKPDRKQVEVTKFQNPPCNFFLFTEVPVAGHILGMILNDLANEFDPNAPTFGEKHAPPWLPISIRDHTGREVSRVYSDQWGMYNALVPSTYSVNPPFPSGVSPKMMTVVLNSPGPILDTDPASATYGQYITDPFFNRQYSQFSYTFQYDPGKTTYLDTPVLPVAAFVGPGQLPLDCDFPDGTPVIWTVENGPYVSSVGQTISIASAGLVDVPNPLYVPGGTVPITVKRDYGFGTTPGTVTIGGVALTNVNWSDGAISGTVAPGTETGELIITRSNGVKSPVGITVTVGPLPPGVSVHQVVPSGTPGATPIQDAVDAASPGDLILVAPGTYDELVIMWQPVQIQGFGAYATTINAVKSPLEKLEAWRARVQSLVMQGFVDLVPGQEQEFGGIEPGTLNSEEGPGILVMGRNTTPGAGGFGPDPNARIDGLTITGADHAGAIMVNGYARYLEISNNHITGNQGFFGGGIRLGHPELTEETADGLRYANAHNDHVRIHHNHIDENGALGGAGGGVSIHTGSDFYEVTDNYICGNFTTGSGAGIGHQGLSDGGIIARNVIRYNQSFNQTGSPSGGGIYIAGGAPLEPSTITEGSGSVMIDANLIQANQAGAGNGGGIATELVNGEDVLDDPDPASWYAIEITNNIVANNVAGFNAGGISMQDTAMVRIIHNTVVHNDSTATAGLAFSGGDPNQSVPRAAGIVSFAHSEALNGAIGTDPSASQYAEYSNPLLVSNIIWQNRSFYFAVNQAQTPPFSLLPAPNAPDFWDLEVVGTDAPARMQPLNGILTDPAGYDPSNIAADPRFIAEYFNGAPGQTIILPEFTTAIEVAAAFDEGGNFIDVHFGPLTPVDPATGDLIGDYHIQRTSPAIGRGAPNAMNLLSQLNKDHDGQTRPNGSGPDAGADEYFATNAPPDANASPIARNDVFSTSQFLGILPYLQLKAPGVMANDFDPDGDPLSAFRITSTRHGIIRLFQDGSLLYIANPFYTGIDRFSYRVNDGQANSTAASVTIYVNRQGATAPVAQNDAYTTTTGVALQVAAPGVLANDTDASGSSFWAEPAAPAVSHGTLDLNTDGSFFYVPTPGYSGTDTFGYTAYNGRTSNVATVTITIQAQTAQPNVAPVPFANAIMVMMDTVGFTRVLPRDPNVGDMHTYAISTPPANGTAEINPTGIVTYTPNAMFTGDDSIVVTVTDQGGLSGQVTIAVMVSAMPDMLPFNNLIQRGGPEDHFIHLAAGDGFVKMADGKVLYCFGFSDMTNVHDAHVPMEGMLAASFPGPTAVLKEGEKVYLNVTNVGMVLRPDLFDPHTVHFHGFPNAAPVFDGEPETSFGVNMGGTLAYYYEPLDPGTYMYHCHMEATEHMQMGMLSNLYVTPKQDGTEFTWNGREFTKFAYNDGDGSTGYDADYPIQLGSFDSFFHETHLDVQPLPMALMKDDYAMINGRGYPDTVVPGPLPAPEENGGKVSQPMSALIQAGQNQRILLRISNLNVTRLYTLACLGIPMEVVGDDARLLRSAAGENLSYKTNSVTLGGGESYDVILDTTGVAPGTYVLYTTNLNYLSNNQEDFGGMMTEIIVTE